MGFSLIELVIVIVIIGVIGAIAIPRMSRGSANAAKNAFIRDLKVFVQAAELYRFETGDFLPDSSSGALPNKTFADYVVAQTWTNGTPIGGLWDTELRDSGGHTAALGVHFRTGNARDASYMQDIDAAIDDGNLKTGSFRAVGDDRYYWIVSE